MNRSEKQFFALLQSGLWGSKPDESLFDDITDWQAVLKIASMQTVIGFVFDGISNLPLHLQPSSDILQKLYITVVRIENSHELLNDRLTRIVPLLSDENIYPVLLKGQGVALNYPNPTHRQCGDIDLYVGEEDYKKACNLVIEKGMASLGPSSESYKHFHFDWDGVHIELHRMVAKIPNPFIDKKFQEWTAFHLHKDRLLRRHINNTEILLPPPNFNALYIFYHAFHHFVSDGVGCRQLCDWVMCLHQFRDTINRDLLLADLKRFRLLRVWQIFGCIAVHQLGLPHEEFPFYTDSYSDISQDVILRDILQLGNFGRYDKKWKTRPAGYLSGKLHNFRMKNRRAVKLFPAMRSNVFYYYIYYLLIGVNQIVNDKIK